MNIPSLSMSMANQNPNRSKYVLKKLNKDPQKPAPAAAPAEFAEDEGSLDITI